MADRIGVINKGELIVVEDTEVLVRKLGKRQLTLQLAKRLEHIPDQLAELALALSDDHCVLTYTFDIQGEDTGIAKLLKLLGEQGIDVKDLHTHESSLEDIFVSLVQEPR
jgi:ABC-2 type transport system ATP-binding protein